MKAAVLEEIGKPLAIREIEDWPIPSPGHIYVSMISSGICGAQIDEIDGRKGKPEHCPHLLGHEGCGATNFGKVVVHWRKGEGLDPDPVTWGEIKAGPCTTFSEITFVSANRVTAIPSDVPNDLASLLGCCLSTALATMENVARIKTWDSVLVIGCGGLGLAMILAARSIGCHHVVATDREFSKWKLARKIGADRFFPAYTQFHWQDFTGNTDHSQPEPSDSPRYDVIIDTVGAMTRTELLKKDGRHIVMTGPNKNTEGGDFNPTKDIPRYIQMWRDGKLNGWENIITHRIKLDQINEGIELMRTGKAGRVMIDFT